jgi:hypothetical protein
LLLVAAPARAATLYVDDDAPAGGDGSRARPFADLQAAIDAAADGDDILVAGGTYAPIAVNMKEVRLRGGYGADFAATSADTPSRIVGTPAGPVVTLFETGDSVVDGFVIRGGQRGISIDADYLSTTNRPDIRNNVIEENGSAAMVGGGIFAIHCNASITGNTIRDNIGDRGAGIAAGCASIRIEDNVVENNVAHGDHGGGIYLYGEMLEVRRNVIRNNEVGVIATYGWGAGLLVYGEGSVAVSEGNVFTENHAMSLGSGAFVDDGASVTFVNDLFHHNDCGTAGGAALYVDGYDTDVSSTARLVNVTIADHDCPASQGNAIAVEAQSRVELVNAIVWGNGDDFIADATSSITATYTLSAESIAGEGNLSADPLFADPANGDYHVRSTQGRYDPSSGLFVTDGTDSPTIDAGDPTSDFAMEPGPNGLRINLGHTGNTREASMGGPGGMPPDAGVRADGGMPSNDDAGSAPDAGTSGSSASDDDGCSATASHGLLAPALLVVAIGLSKGRRTRARRRR